MHVIDRENPYRPSVIPCRVNLRFRVRYTGIAAPFAKPGKRESEFPQPGLSRFHDHLEGDDFVAGAEKLDCFAVPGGVAFFVWIVQIEPVDFFTVVYRPDASHFSGSACCSQPGRSEK